MKTVKTVKTTVATLFTLLALSLASCEGETKYIEVIKEVEVEVIKEVEVVNDSGVILDINVIGGWERQTEGGTITLVFDYSGTYATIFLDNDGNRTKAKADWNWSEHGFLSMNEEKIGYYITKDRDTLTLIGKEGEKIEYKSIAI